MGNFLVSFFRSNNIEFKNKCCKCNKSLKNKDTNICDDCIDNISISSDEFSDGPIIIE